MTIKTAQPTTAEMIGTLRNSLTPGQIAQGLGVHVSTVYRWARGVSRPTGIRLGLLAAMAALATS